MLGIVLLNWLCLEEIRPVQKATMNLNTAVHVGDLSYAPESTVDLGLHQLLQGNVSFFKVLGYLHFTCGLVVRLDQFELTIILNFLSLKLSFELLIF